MKRIALVLAFAFLLLDIGGCEAGSITYDSGNNTIIVVGLVRVLHAPLRIFIRQMSQMDGV